MKMARKQCRVWCPRQLLLCEPSCNLLLFGWCMNSFNSLDIVLAFATSTLEISVNLLQQNLQEIVGHVDAKMPVTLQKSSTFSILGLCILESNTQNMKVKSNQCIGSSSKTSRGKMNCLEVENNTSTSILNDSMHNYSSQKSFVRESLAADCGIDTCGCMKLDPSVDTQRQALIRCGYWIQLFCRMQGNSYKRARWIPEFDHIHHNGDMLPITDFHIDIS